ncbi:753_t:CDS:2 [Gigaspora margarita]|uniref:753_t:CDS:1 n=1 Tax=Gigaspora margarita TaxID=4874 RepID=A0ABN7VDV6_GIGMA|nr:753_t:CDS:2 [Gigaspora margarita]
MDIVVNNGDALQSFTQGKKKCAYTCGICGKDGHHRSTCPNKK